MRGFASDISRFSNLKILILNLNVQGCTDAGSGIVRLAYLLVLAPVLEELELNVSDSLNNSQTPDVAILRTTLFWDI